MQTLKLLNLRGPCLAGLMVAAAALGACSKTPADAPVLDARPNAQAPASAASAGTNTSTSTSADVSVPAANTVLTPAPATPLDPVAGRPNKAMSKAQESNAMPMPGQNNDHSAPLPPAKRASSP